MAKSYLGIEIGGTKLQLVTGDADAIQTRHRVDVDRAKGAEGIRGQIEAALGRILSASAPVAIAVGFGGPVDYRSGRIARSHQLGGWADFDLRQWLQQLTGKPVRVDNDANMGALGEASRGAGVGFDPVFYVTLGSGVGGGLVVGRGVYHGATPGEAEIGHVRLERTGATVESRCSGWAVDAKVRELKASGSKSLLYQLAGAHAGGEAKHLAPALAQGDTAARKILTETADDLAFGLSHVVHLFHPKVIVLGGGLALVGEPLRAEVARALEGYTMDAFRGGVQVRLAALGEDAVPMGCLIAAEALASAEGA